jgi:UDP-galactose transporter B1
MEKVRRFLILPRLLEMAYIKLMTYSLCLYFCFISWGILQERISSTLYGNITYFRSFVVLNMLQSIACCFWAYIYYIYQRITIKSKFSKIILWENNPILWRRYFQIAFINALASPFGYHALNYINYPTLILAKSCKLVPVMIIGVLMFRKHYQNYKYLSVALITFGVSLFMLTSSHSKISSIEHPSLKSHLIGLFLVAINLFLDGLTNASQDEVFHSYKVSASEMMFYMNLLGVFWMILYLYFWPWQTEWKDAIYVFLVDSTCLRDVALFVLCGTIGQTFVYATIQYFGAMTLITITVTRKLVTILLSVFLFKHEVNISQWFGVMLVFGGISIEAYAKERQKYHKPNK